MNPMILHNTKRRKGFIAEREKRREKKTLWGENENAHL